MKKKMSIEAYHEHDSISKSRLDQVNKSLLHYENPYFKRSPSMDLGSAVHDAILEPELFEANYIKQPKDIKVRRGKIWDEFLSENDGKTVLKADEYEKVLAIRDRVQSHPIAKIIFTGGEPEMSYFSTMEIDGTEVDVRCRPDYVNKNVIIDLKTTASAHPDKFRNSITNFRYHVQAAFYLDIINKVNNTEIDEFIFVAIETEFPYAMGVYMIDRESIDCGRSDYQENLSEIVSQMNDPIIPTGYTDNRIDVIGCNEFYFYKKIKGV